MLAARARVTSDAAGLPKDTPPHPAGVKLQSAFLINYTTRVNYSVLTVLVTTKPAAGFVCVGFNSCLF